eukprot:7344512-Pyramimonas_sp.AAC.1
MSRWGAAANCRALSHSFARMMSIRRWAAANSRGNRGMVPPEAPRCSVGMWMSAAGRMGGHSACGALVLW